VARSLIIGFPFTCAVALNTLIYSSNQIIMCDSIMI